MLNLSISEPVVSICFTWQRVPISFQKVIASPGLDEGKYIDSIHQVPAENEADPFLVGINDEAAEFLKLLFCLQILKSVS